MSGGVDSSVSAALLKKQGYDVTGVFIKPWDPSEAGWGVPCNWREERREAMRVAAHLGIPLLTLDASHQYKKEVVDYLIAEYKAGRTPNPDVMCNKMIKFGVFYNWAMKQGADYISTGHYAQIGKLTANSPDALNLKVGIPTASRRGSQLTASKDKEKDQTYFLWNLRQEQLARILFPVGGYTKPEVRALAKKFCLPNAEKKDSQGLCFIGKIDFKEFLRHEIKEKPGKVLNEKGEAIGQHNGAVFFTIGERHGFTVEKKSPDDRPYFVIAKDLKKNTLTVSHLFADEAENPEASIAETLEVKITQTNWIGKLTVNSKQLTARVRYRQPLKPCTLLNVNRESAIVKFEEPQLAAPGQSLVLYDGDECLGGGVIE